MRQCTSTTSIFVRRSLALSDTAFHTSLDICIEHKTDTVFHTVDIANICTSQMAFHTAVCRMSCDNCFEITQKRALHIIYGGSSFNNYSYKQFCNKLCISSLSARRDQLTSCFFHKILQPTSCLHHLIPPRRDNSQTAKLRKPIVYDIPLHVQINSKTHLFCMHSIITSSSQPFHLSHLFVSFCIVFNVYVSL